MLEPEDTDADAFMRKLLLDAETSSGMPGTNPGGNVPYIQVVPEPGFCLKTKKETGEKVFINVCQAENVPEPKDITEEELIKVLDSHDPFGFRVPMSIGEPHAELDKVGKGCTAYDVIVHPKFFEKMVKSNVFQGFFLSVMMEGLEDKYNITLNRDWVILKNRKSIGTLAVQYVRTQSKPVVTDMDNIRSHMGTDKSKPLIQEMDPSKPLSKEELKLRGQEPDYRIIQEPPEGHPDFLVAEISLPHVKVASTVSLDIGEDRILLQTRSNKYYMDIYLPYLLVQEDCGCQFNRKTRILTITMPVQPEG